jgi:hypothetical protein
MPAVTVPPRRWRAYWVLGAALVASLLVHLVLSLWPVRLATARDEPPLAVSITELPPPPVPVAPPPVAKPAAKPAAKARPHHVSPLVPPQPTDTPDVVAATAPAAAPAPAAAAEPAAAPLANDTPAAPPPASDKALPPRVDLVYKLYLGSQGFLIGDATYRFEHADNHYRISTVGQARGLAALLVRGEGKLESSGMITAEGLQPTEFSFERTDTGKREQALFDWDTGLVTLTDNKTATIETPMFDALSLMWQYYFTPPTSATTAFSLVTTRRVTRYAVTNEGSETIRWGQGRIETERWHRVSDDGKNNSYAWLAPSLRFLPVKMQLSNPRGTVDVVLDSIRVDPSVKAAGDSWAPHIEGGTANLGTPAVAPLTAPPPQQFAPGATFPTNTGS